MQDLVKDLSMFADGVKAIGVFLTVVWGLLIVVEWYVLSSYYHAFHIEHSFRPNYKIAFNPRYVATVLYSLLLLSYVQFAYAQIYMLLASLFVCVAIWMINATARINHNKKLDQLKKSVKPCALDFRKEFRKWKSADSGMKICCVILIDIILGLIANSVSPLLIDQIRFLPHIIWVLFVCVVVHILLNELDKSYYQHVNSIEYLRLIEENGKFYSILAPMKADNNDVCVAVRTIVCKTKNDLIYGYLLLDDSISMKAPYCGDSFLISVDFISRVGYDDHVSALYTEEDLRKSAISLHSVTTYLVGREWRPIKELGK